MGATILWQPQRGTEVPVGARSRFIEVMTEAFGAYPWNLTAGSADKLRSIAIGADDHGIKAALQSLADRVEEHDAITVWPEY